MLGIRLKPEEEAMLDRHARAVGRPKSAIARDWIKERLEREAVDVELSRAAAIIAAHEGPILQGERSAHATDAFLRMLDELDGGYDWGPDGAPA